MRLHFIILDLMLQDASAYYKVRGHVKRCGCMLYGLAISYDMWLHVTTCGRVLLVTAVC